MGTTRTTNIASRVRGAHLVAEWAQINHLPEPIVVKATSYADHVEVLFRTRDDLAAWAKRLDVEVIDNTILTMGQPLTDVAKVETEIYEVPVVLSHTAAHPVRDQVGA